MVPFSVKTDTDTTGHGIGCPHIQINLLLNVINCILL